MSFSVLLVEDSLSDIEVFKSTIEVMNDAETGDIQYEVDVAGKLEEAKKKLEEKQYNGCVVDINLNANEDGNEVIKYIMETYRMPVVIFSGTPDMDADSIVKYFVKGEIEHKEVIQELVDQNSTGIFRVLGGKGTIEEWLKGIFWEILYPHIETWKEYSTKKKDTEQILLRYTIAHLQEMLDEVIPEYCTEEMYICRETSNSLKTGAIFKKNDGDIDYVLLSPPCDLVIHDNALKSDSLLLCEVEKIPPWHGLNKDKKNDIIKNRTNNYHWLPDNELYRGGRLNFRKLKTYSKEELDQNFTFINVKIQDQFVKNILNRFSAYYARQGQPDFCFEEERQNRSQ